MSPNEMKRRQGNTAGRKLSPSLPQGETARKPFFRELVTLHFVYKPTVAAELEAVPVAAATGCVAAGATRGETL